MSALIRGFQIFSGLGTVATTPFAVQFANKHLNRLPSRGERLVSGGPEIPQENPVPQSETKLQDVMEKAKQIMSKEEGEGEGEGEKKCFWWPKVKRRLELLGCFYTNKLNQVFLFHWDYNGRLGLEEKLNQIVSLSKGVKMKFENHQPIQLTSPAKLSFAWLHKWDGEFTPKQHCEITTTGKNSKNYTLICGKRQQEKNHGKPFLNESINF